MVKKFYAVKVGKQSGIYTSWAECEKEIKGVKGAIYKSFKTEEEAYHYLNQKEYTLSEITLDSNSLVAYIDGSFLKGKIFSCGCVFLYQGNIVNEISEKYEDVELSSMRNVAGEIKAAELAMAYALQNKYSELIICHDYEGISRWPLGEWSATKKGTKEYKKYYDMISKEINVKFVKVKAHSGNEFNERADELAKKALNIEK